MSATTVPSSTHQRAEPTHRVHSWTARHPLTAFLALAMGAGYPLVLAVLLMTRGVLPGGGLVERLPIAPDELAGLLLTLGALLPATLYVTWATEGPDGLRRLAARAARWRVAARWWLLVVAGLPVLTVLLAVVMGDELRSVRLLPFAAGQVVALLVNLALVNLWEETAWSGLMQTRLERRHSLYVAALITAVPFALLHWPLAFFDRGREVTLAGVAVALAGYLVISAIFRPMLAVVLRGTAGSVLLVAVMHSVFNRSNNQDGIVAGLLDGENRGLTVLVAALLMTAAGAVLARHSRGRLGHPRDGVETVTSPAPTPPRHPA
jgi:membrane protease YdiL (CAAX protease family)